MTRVLVTGGTGGLGHDVIARLLENGSTVRLMSRSPRRGTPNAEWAQAHLLTGAGLVRPYCQCGRRAYARQTDR